MKATHLYRNPKKTKRILAAAAATSAVLLLMVLYGTGLIDGEIKTRLAVFSGGALIVMLFLCWSTLSGIRDKSPMIQLDDSGFSGRTAALPKAFGRADWVDVAAIQMLESGGDRLVAVTISNTRKYEGRLSKMFWNMAFDAQRRQLQLTYSSSETDLEPDELYGLFLDYWNSARDSTGGAQN